MQTQTEPPVIEAMGEIKLVGTARTYTMETRAQIPAQWQAFFEAGYDIANAIPGAMYGVSISGSPEGFRYGVGLAVNKVASIPEGTCEMVLSGGDYAVLRAKGPVSDLPQHFDWMFSTWLPGSEYGQREGAVFERYPDDPDNTPDMMRYEIWVPVRHKG